MNQFNENPFGYGTDKAVTITSPFGLRPVPTGDGDFEFHNGVDLAADLNQPIVAWEAAYVEVVNHHPRYGNGCIVVTSRGRRIRLAHMLPSVFNGAKVKRGQVIGTIDLSGRTTGPHLHWEEL